MLRALFLPFILFWTGACQTAHQGAASDLLGPGGVVDGSGGGIQLEPTEVPHLEQLKAYLAKLGVYEPTWVRIINLAFDPATGIIFSKTVDEDPCYINGHPEIPIRAYYNKNSSGMTFCKDFYRKVVNGNEIDTAIESRLATILHELTHFALSKLVGNYSQNPWGNGEEQIVALMEYYYLQSLKSNSPKDFEKAVLEIRKLLDRFVPQLRGAMDENQDLPEWKLVKIFASPTSVSQYPVPSRFLEPDFVTPHFFEIMLAKLWSKTEAMHAMDLVSLDVTPLKDVFAADDPLWNYEFTYDYSEPGEGAGGWVFGPVKPKHIADLLKACEATWQSAEPECDLPYKPLFIPKAQLSADFLQVIESGKLSYSAIRTFGTAAQQVPLSFGHGVKFRIENWVFFFR